MRAVQRMPPPQNPDDTDGVLLLLQLWLILTVGAAVLLGLVVGAQPVRKGLARPRVLRELFYQS